MSVPDLEKKASAACEAAAKTLTGHAVVLESLESEIEWDDRDMRHSYEYAAEVFAEGPRFDVVVNAANQPVGFVDWSKWRECQWVPFAREKVVLLAAETGLVSPTALLISFSRGEKGCVEARILSEPENPSSLRYKVRINPYAGRIISMLPEPLEL